MSKTGVQIVGFGNPNSMAIEIRSEDTDKTNVSDTERRGVFESGIYFKNSIAQYGRLMVSDLAKARIGLDFENTLFTEGAIKLNSNQVGTGIIYNNGRSGEIYGGSRWDASNTEEDYLTIRAGENGIRIVSNDNTSELVLIDNNGEIHLNGNVYVNGQQLSDTQSYNPYQFLFISLIIIIIINVGLVSFILFKMQKISRTVHSLNKE